MNTVHALARTANIIDRINETVGRIVSWLVVLMVLTTFVIVVLRYAFGMGWIALQESVTWMHGLLFLLAAGYTLAHDAHVRVDVFYRDWPARKRAWVDLIGTLLLLVPTMAFIFAMSWGYVTQSWALHEGSAEAGGLPAIYLLKTAIPTMAVLVALQGLSLAARSVLTLLGAAEASRPAAHDELV